MKMIYKALLSIIIIALFNSNGFSQATLSIGSVSGISGTSVSLPIQATGIVDMTGFQFTIAYDKTKLTFVNCTNWVGSVNATNVQINPLDGKLTFVYTDAAINIANGKFFDLNFTVLSGTSGSAAISWSDSPTQRELSNSIPNEISCIYSNGAVVISVASLLAPVATAATNIAQTSFSANWNSSTSATGYRLDVALDNGFTNYLTGYQNKDVGNVTTLQISGLSINAICYYRVRAYNAEATSEVSNIITVTTLQGSAPASPLATAATNIAQTSFSANWNPSATATGYRLDVALDNTFTSYLTGYQNKEVGNVVTIPVTGLTANTTYYYRIKAYNSEGTSSVSNTINATTSSNQSGATLTIGNGTGTSGNTVSIPVTATNFSDVVGFQFTIVFDKTKLTFVNCTNWVSGLNASQVQINSLDGKLTFVYTDAAINISSGKFFDLNFTVLNGTSGNAAISWSDNPTQRELSNSIPNEISCAYNDGILTISDDSSLAPVANFLATTTNGCAPLTVSFTDESTGNPTSWEWDVDNDGGVDYTDQNPTHTFSNTGNYTVKLTVRNASGSNTITRTDYINTSTNGSAKVSIDASPSSIINSGQLVTFTATPTFGGTGPYYLWMLDGSSVGVNSPTFQTSKLTDGQKVQCVMSSNSPCVVSTIAYSNVITMKVGNFIAPELINWYPVNKTISENHPIFTMSFRENIFSGVGGNLKVFKAGTNTPLLTIPILSTMITGKDVIISYPSSQPGLDSNTIYYVLVDGTALKDNLGVAFGGVSDANSWTFKTGSFTGINPILNEPFKVKVYPNPVTNELTIELEDNTQKVDFEIINSLGQSVFSGVVFEKAVVQTTNFVSGIYLIKLKSGKTIEFKKIIKE